MNNEKNLRRRNISWPKSVDSLAERLAVDKAMNVSELLETLVVDEARQNRIKPGPQSPLHAMIADIVSAQLDKAGTGAKKIANKLKAASRKKKNL